MNILLLLNYCNLDLNVSVKWKKIYYDTGDMKFLLDRVNLISKEKEVNYGNRK